jgi:putative ABC transport system substrate-binding protein
VTTRRELIATLGGVLICWPLSALAQREAKLWRIGYIATGTRSDAASLDGLRHDMVEVGYAEGRDFVIESRFGDGKVLGAMTGRAYYERIRSLATELLKLKVDVIVASGTPGVEGTRQATATTPIVMVNTGDPARSGFVQSLSRPGRNITGLSNVSVDVSSKYLEPLQVAIPKLSRVAVVLEAGHQNHPDILKQINAAAKSRDIKVVPLEAGDLGRIEAALDEAKRVRADALIVPSGPLFNSHRHRIAELALKNRLPTLTASRQWVEAGALMCYGQSQFEQGRRAASYVDKILKGAKPADLPVQEPTTFELLVNRKTAQAIGITIPQELLLRADKVIE